MKVGHQPNYLPYLVFFDKIEQSDIFVIYEDAKFNKEDFQHGNKIKIFYGWKWLTVPVEKKIMFINMILAWLRPSEKLYEEQIYIANLKKVNEEFIKDFGEPATEYLCLQFR